MTRTNRGSAFSLTVAIVRLKLWLALIPLDNNKYFASEVEIVLGVFEQVIGYYKGVLVVEGI